MAYTTIRWKVTVKTDNNNNKGLQETGKQKIKLKQRKKETNRKKTNDK